MFFKHYSSYTEINIMGGVYGLSAGNYWNTL